MDQPTGFVASGNEKKVCRLVKSIYGLKQAPKEWHKKFDESILDFEFLVNESYKCVYYKDLLTEAESGFADCVNTDPSSRFVEHSKY
ncbi:hypothetical protein AgCh_036207 [Apium graveolens]